MQFQFLLLPDTHTCQWCEIVPASLEVTYPETLVVSPNESLVQYLCERCYSDLFAWEEQYA